MPKFPKMAGPIQKLSGQGGCHAGRRGLPREWVLEMYEDYKRLGSLEKVAALHDRTRQGMFGIFQTHKLKLNPKKFLPVVTHNGIKFTQQKVYGKHKYLRATIRKKGKPTLYLHHVIWEENNGPIPVGHQVGFKDGDQTNCAIDNLICLPWGEMTRRNATGENGATKNARERLGLLLNGKGAQLAKLQKAKA